MAYADEDVSGEYIGPYRNIEDLGVGGYSRVKLAIDTRSNTYVAVKILLSEKVTDKNTNITKWIMSDSKVKQCKREVGLMQQIQHKNVVRLHDLIEDATFPQYDGNNASIPTPCLCVVLEYCSRGELFDFLMYTGRLGERATRTYFHQFLDGLAAMHKSGYAHRDLKPENLLLSEDFTLKIADFGFATQFKDGRKKIKMATTCGTKGYLAPELLAGKKYTHKVDLFAVGIIMFTTFAGFPPFQHAGQGDWWWDKMAKAWTYWTESPLAPNDIEREERYKKGNEKMRLFWAAHERSLPFDDNFKDLMQNLLNPFPKQRFDIEDCLRHPWMRGKTFSKRSMIKYMKAFSATVRAQRAIKIDKQLQDQNMKEERQQANIKRALLEHTQPEVLDRQAELYTEAVSRIEEIPAIVTKANFKFETEEDMKEILTSIDMAARAHQAYIDLDIPKCEVKIIASVSRQNPNTTTKKGGPKVLQPEDVQIAVKIYKAELTTFDEQLPDGTFDIEGEFLNQDEKDYDDDSSQEDEKADTPSIQNNNNNNDNNNDNNNNGKQKWAIFFYRIRGSADGFQQLMEKIFYAPLVESLMLTSGNIPKDEAIKTKIEKMDETARAFLETFNKPPTFNSNLDYVSNVGFGDLPAPDI